MTTPTGTIDLGALIPGPAPEPDAPWPVLVRLRRWHSPRRTTRLTGLTAVTVLALLAVTGAAAPPEPTFTPHLTLPAVHAFIPDQQDLYLVEALETNQLRVAAYRLTDRSIRWVAPLPASDFAWLELEDGVLLVQSFGPTGSHTTGLDPDTGRELWSRPGVHEHTLGSGLHVFSDAGVGSPEIVEGPPQQELTAVDLTTDRPVWTVSVTGGNHVRGGPDSRYLVVSNEINGEMVSYDLATGERLASADVPRADSVGIQVVGSLVVSVDQWSSPPTVTGYDVTTLTPRWITTDRNDPYTWAVPCGDLLCLLGAEPPRAIDLASGELVWSADWLPPASDEGTYWVSEPAGAGLAGRLLVTDRTGSHGWLVDARTGTLVLDLGGWQLSPDSPLLFWTGAESVTIGQLHPDLSGIQALAAVEVAPWSALSPPQCRSDTGYVYCVAASDPGGQLQELTVWRHRLP
ncbi:MAG: PQQ-binding-like beta-propeller repeat protein [Natronosporangium sp.]